MGTISGNSYNTLAGGVVGSGTGIDGGYLKNCYNTGLVNATSSSILRAAGVVRKKWMGR